MRRVSDYLGSVLQVLRDLSLMHLWKDSKINFFCEAEKLVTVNICCLISSLDSSHCAYLQGWHTHIAIVIWCVLLTSWVTLPQEMHKSNLHRAGVLVYVVQSWTTRAWDTGVPNRYLRTKPKWPLNNMGLNCMDPLIHGFLPNKYWKCIFFSFWFFLITFSLLQLTSL